MATRSTDVEWTVTREHDAASLAAVVRVAMHATWNAARRWITTGRVRIGDDVATDAGTRVATGQRITISPDAARAPAHDSLPRDALVYVDTHVVVVDKPAGISTVPFDEGERGTLVDRVRVMLRHVAHAPANAPLFVVHRIDKETSGLVVFARTWLAQRHLAALFRSHAVERSYLAICDGYLTRDRTTFDTHLVANRGDGLRGSAKQPGLGVRAVTHVETLERLRGPSSLLRCTLETGKTHQIRIHLAEAGHPLLGEPVYARHFAQPMAAAPRLMLHAEKLAFTHPARRDEVVAWTRDPPDDFARVLAGLRAKR